MSAPLKRSAKFYQEPLVFRVEDTLFKVARCYFEQHSAFFKDMLNGPIESDQPYNPGDNDEHPLVLEGVKAENFEKFLDLAFPTGTYHNALPRIDHPYNGPMAMTSEEVAAKHATERYSPLIELCQRWGFRDIHAECIRRLGGYELKPAARFALGIQHHIPQWIRKGCLELVRRPERLSKEEAGLIGVMNTLGVCNLRELVSGDSKKPIDIDAEIEETFKDELASAEQMYKDFYGLK